MLALVASPSSNEHLELRDVPDPTPAPDETVLQVEAISLNRGELNRLASAEDGARLGWDIAGVVQTPAANGAGLPEGTRAVGFVQGGGWAQRVAVPNPRVARIPDALGMSVASTLPVAGLTALRMLRIPDSLLGKHVLVTGAAGGVGRYAIQLAHMAGARVTGIVGSPERGEGLRKLGADDLLTEIDGATQFDVILESVGGHSLAAALRALAPKGTLVTFGNSARKPTTIDISTFYGKCARVVGFSLLAPSQWPDFRDDLSYLANLTAEGRLNSQIDLEESWQNAASALAALRERRVRGKAVLHVEP